VALRVPCNQCIMTVEQLINELKTLPPTAEVMLSYRDGHFKDEVKEVRGGPGEAFQFQRESLDLPWQVLIQ